MLALAIAAATSVVLGLLLAAASMARAGFRGYRLLFWAGLPVGLAIGYLDPAEPVERALTLAPPLNLYLQFLGMGLARGAVFALLFAVALGILVGWVFRGRRAADFIGAGAGLGLGLGLASTGALFAAETVWLPNRIILVLSNLPFQVCFGLFMAWAAMAPNRLAGLGRLGLALVMQLVYQTAMVAMREIGHWLAWLEPGAIALLWVGLIGYFWFLGLMVMHIQAAGEPPARHRPPPAMAESAQRPRVWYIVAALVLVPSLALLVAALLVVGFAPGLGRMMLFVILAVPLMAGAVLWRTGLALRGADRRRPGPVLPRWRRPRSA